MVINILTSHHGARGWCFHRRMGRHPGVMSVTQGDLCTLWCFGSIPFGPERGARTFITHNDLHYYLARDVRRWVSVTCPMGSPPLGWLRHKMGIGGFLIWMVAIRSRIRSGLIPKTFICQSGIHYYLARNVRWWWLITAALVGTPRKQGVRQKV